MYYVYILSTDDKHYIWYSWDIQKRLSEHQNKEVFTTKKYENIKLLWYFIKNTKTEAINMSISFDDIFQFYSFSFCIFHKVSQ